MPTESSPQDKPPAKPSLYVVANVAHDDVLNVRSGPSADFDVVGELQPGSRGVSITGMCRSQWCPVQHESTSGWVNRSYLANDGAAIRIRFFDPRRCRWALARLERSFLCAAQLLDAARPCTPGKHRREIRAGETCVHMPAWRHDCRQRPALAARHGQRRRLRRRQPQGRDYRVADRQPPRRRHHDLFRHGPHPHRYRPTLRIDRGWATVGKLARLGTRLPGPHGANERRRSTKRQCRRQRASFSSCVLQWH